MDVYFIGLYIVPYTVAKGTLLGPIFMGYGGVMTFFDLKCRDEGPLATCCKNGKPSGNFKNYHEAKKDYKKSKLAETQEKDADAGTTGNQWNPNAGDKLKKTVLPVDPDDNDSSDELFSEHYHKRKDVEEAMAKKAIKQQPEGRTRRGTVYSPPPMTKQGATGNLHGNKKQSRSRRSRRSV